MFLVHTGSDGESFLEKTELELERLIGRFGWREVSVHDTPSYLDIILMFLLLVCDISFCF